MDFPFLLAIYFIYLPHCVCVCVSERVCVHKGATVHMWRSEYNFLEPVLSFRYVDLGDQTQAIILDGQARDFIHGAILLPLISTLKRQ